MIEWLSWLIPIALLFLSVWYGVVERVFANGRRTQLQSRIAARTGTDAVWVESTADTIVPFARLKGLGTDLLVILFVVYHTAGFPSEQSFTVLPVVVGFVVGLFIVWISSTVLAGAIAKHGGVWLLSGTLPMLRLLAWGSGLSSGLVRFVDEVIRRLSGAGPRHDDAEEELLRSIEASQREGSLPPHAAEMLENVVEFSETDVGEIMTPRTDMEGIERTDDLVEIRRFVIESGHSRIPVFEENLDHILGILYVKDLIGFLGEEANGFNLENVLRQPIVIPESKPVQELLGDFQKSEVHMAIVIDEYGGTAGLVTIEDVLEEIVGEIRDEHDETEAEEPELVRLDSGRVQVSGRFDLDDLNDELGLALPEDEEYDTIAGFVLAKLGHVPNAGESLEVDGITFTALAATPTHIELIAIDLPLDAA